MKRVLILPVSLLVMTLLACTGDEDPPATAPVIAPPPTESFGVRVRVVTTGTDLDTDGYVVRIQRGYSAGGFDDVPIGVNGSVLFEVMQRPAPEGWFVRLTGIEPNCWVSLPNLRSVAPRSDSYPQLVYSVECISPSRVNIYERVTPHGAGSVSFHGSLSERYVLRQDGMFRLQYTSSRWGLFEYLGTFTQAPTDSPRLQYSWDSDARWSGSAILRNDSLFVDYNDIMLLSDFEPGVFVKSRQ
jgi:hypothetical protein